MEGAQESARALAVQGELLNSTVDDRPRSGDITYVDRVHAARGNISCALTPDSRLAGCVAQVGTGRVIKGVRAHQKLNDQKLAPRASLPTLRDTLTYAFFIIVLVNT
eukprot:7777772-Pyramimonas_sp.AAC.1